MFSSGAADKVFRLDSLASTVHVDATGNFAVLAERRGLAIYDLELPYRATEVLSAPSTRKRGGGAGSAAGSGKSGGSRSSGPGSARWNPHRSHCSFIASTAGRAAHVWNTDSAPTPLTATLVGHTRRVSDVAWSPGQPDTLASTGGDGRVLLWDIRQDKPLVGGFTGTGDATVVAWNRQRPMVLASAHDHEVRIWDVRRAESGGVGGVGAGGAGSDAAPGASSSGDTLQPASEAVAAVSAHRQKIYGVDWSHRHAYELVTCSQDRSAKIWGTEEVVLKLRCMITSPFPLRSAQFTPFGQALMTIADRGDHSLRLWGLKRKSDSYEAVSFKTFVGHTDVVRAFDWRQRDAGEFQVVSWSKDQNLRYWGIDSSVIARCSADDEAAADGSVAGLTDDDADAAAAKSSLTVAETRGGEGTIESNGSNTAQDVQESVDTSSQRRNTTTDPPAAAGDAGGRQSSPVSAAVPGFAPPDGVSRVAAPDDAPDAVEAQKPSTLGTAEGTGRSGADGKAVDGKPAVHLPGPQVSSSTLGSESSPGMRAEATDRLGALPGVGGPGEQEIAQRARRLRSYSDGSIEHHAGVAMAHHTGEGMPLGASTDSGGEEAPTFGSPTLSARSGRSRRASARSSILSGERRDLPLPRLCGAAFGPSGQLVVFMNAAAAVTPDMDDLGASHEEDVEITSILRPLPRTYNELVARREMIRAAFADDGASNAKLDDDGTTDSRSKTDTTVFSAPRESPASGSVPEAAGGAPRGRGDSAASETLVMDDIDDAAPSLASITAHGSANLVRGETPETTETPTTATSAPLDPSTIVSRVVVADFEALLPMSRSLVFKYSLGPGSVPPPASRSRPAEVLPGASAKAAERYDYGGGGNEMIPRAGPTDLTSAVEMLPSVCRANAAAARAETRSDVATTWDLLALMSGLVTDTSVKTSSDAPASSSANASQHLMKELPPLPPPLEPLDPEDATTAPAEDTPVPPEMRGGLWAAHPFGRSLLRRLMNFHAAAGDVQTLASMACVMQPEHALDEEDAAHEAQAKALAEAAERAMSYADLSQAGAAPNDPASLPVDFLSPPGALPSRSPIAPKSAESSMQRPVPRPRRFAARSKGRGGIGMRRSQSQPLLHGADEEDAGDSDERRAALARLAESETPRLPSALRLRHAPVSAPQQKEQPGAAELADDGMLTPRQRRWNQLTGSSDAGKTTFGVVPPGGRPPRSRAGLGGLSHGASADLTSLATIAAEANASSLDHLPGERRGSSASNDSAAATHGDLMSPALTPTTHKPHPVVASSVPALSLGVSAVDGDGSARRRSLRPAETAPEAAEDEPHSSDDDEAERELALMDDDMVIATENACHAYAETLYRWGEFSTRAVVLKFSAAPPETPDVDQHRGLVVEVRCINCRRASRRAKCDHCKLLSMRCSVCDIAVRGVSSLCPICGHGGHTVHLASWFAESRDCPTGCGCKCTEASLKFARDVETLDAASAAARKLDPSGPEGNGRDAASAMSPDRQLVMAGGDGLGNLLAGADGLPVGMTRDVHGFVGFGAMALDSAPAGVGVGLDGDDGDGLDDGRLDGFGML